MLLSSFFMWLMLAVAGLAVLLIVCGGLCLCRSVVGDFVLRWAVCCEVEEGLVFLSFWVACRVAFSEVAVVLRAILAKGCLVGSVAGGVSLRCVVCSKFTLLFMGASILLIALGVFVFIHGIGSCSVFLLGCPSALTGSITFQLGLPQLCSKTLNSNRVATNLCN